MRTACLRAVRRRRDTVTGHVSCVVCIEFEVGHMTVARMPPGDVLPLEFPSIKMHFYHPLAHGFWYH